MSRARRRVERKKSRGGRGLDEGDERRRGVVLGRVCRERERRALARRRRVVGSEVRVWRVVQAVMGD